MNFGGPISQRGNFSGLPFEAIDMMSGDLHLEIPLLALDGNAGMGIGVEWVFNRNLGWRLVVPGLPRVIENADGPDGDSPVTIRMFDNAVFEAYPDASLGANMYATDQFWRYSSATKTLWLPNGWKATFETFPGYTTARLQQIDDRFGNALVPHWVSSEGPDTRFSSIDQVSGPSVRTVAFGWDSQVRPTSVSLVGGAAGGGDRTWTFDWNGATQQLAAIHPPMGPAWQFTYADTSFWPPTYMWMQVTTPTGGTVKYNFAWLDTRPVVAERITGGRQITGATWTFEYTNDWQSGEQTGTVHSARAPHPVLAPSA